MKKYFIIAASALVAMCACTKNEVAEAPQQEINFAVANYAAQTKAAYSTDVPFGTYAYFWGEGAEGSASQAFMVDETVSYKSSSSNWSASKTYYWPKSGTIDFISYSPKNLITYNGEGAVDKQYVTIAEEKITFGFPTAYEVAHETTVDVMYADKASDCSKTATASVPTVFRHALSKININIRTKFDEMGVEGDKTKWAVTITKLSVKNYYKTGSAAFTLKDDDTSWNLPENSIWSTSGDVKDIQDFTLPNDATISTTAKDFVTNYYMLPQALGTDDNAQTLYIEAKIVTTLPSGKTITETNVPMSVIFNTTDIPSWQINKNITYNVEINPAGDDGPKAIIFNPSVVDWETPAAQELKPTDK